MSAVDYKHLVDNTNITWICDVCDSPNHSTTLFVSALGDDSTNIYSSLASPSASVSSNTSMVNDSISSSSMDNDSVSSSHEDINISFNQPLSTSTPIGKQQKRRIAPTNTKGNLKIINMNCQSVKHKKDELCAIIESSDPDIIMLSET